MDDSFGEGPSGLVATQLIAISLLGDDLRRGLYSFVREARRPVTREEAARAVGISRKLAAFHLHKLVSAGLLASAPASQHDHRRVGRRPTVYEPTDLEVRVSIPPRDHQLLAEILLDAVAHNGRSEGIRDVALHMARTRGTELGRQQRLGWRGRLGIERARAAALTALRAGGYEPVDEGGAGIRLANCPFRPVTAQFRDLVCALNLEHLQGVVDGLGNARLRAQQERAPGACCVRILLS